MEPCKRVWARLAFLKYSLLDSFPSYLQVILQTLMQKWSSIFKRRFLLYCPLQLFSSHNIKTAIPTGDDTRILKMTYNVGLSHFPFTWVVIQKSAQKLSFEVTPVLSYLQSVTSQCTQGWMRHHYKAVQLVKWSTVSMINQLGKKHEDDHGCQKDSLFQRRTWGSEEAHKARKCWDLRW